MLHLVKKVPFIKILSFLVSILLGVIVILLVYPSDLVEPFYKTSLFFAIAFIISINPLRAKVNKLSPISIFNKITTVTYIIALLLLGFYFVPTPS